MKTSDFDYELPPELVATSPSGRRDACRLMALEGAGPVSPRDLLFSDLPGLLREGDLLVLNDTRVIPARLAGRRLPGGGEAELLLLEPASEDGWTWRCLGRPGRKLRQGRQLEFLGGLGAEIVGEEETGERLARFFRQGAASGPVTPASFLEALEGAGLPPLPPYILAARRQREGDPLPARDQDRADYQTVFAREGQSVAAPTAGLHFTPELLAKLEAMGVRTARVRLDVGAGTFKPVEAEDLAEHPMHEERYWISEEAAEAVGSAKREGRRVVCVGTTSARALESAALAAEAQGDKTGSIRAGESATRLMIAPGHEWKAADALITNFHLPRSTLLMLVSALRSREEILAAYREAVAKGYRFYSYGDAMWIERRKSG